MLRYRLQQLLDVVPADIAGMEYATRGILNGHQVRYSHFMPFST